MPKYMKQRGPRKIWHFQRPIPPDVKGLVDATLFREKSLHTSDEREAEKRVRPYILATDIAIDQARMRKAAPDRVTALPPAQKREVESAGGVDGYRREVTDDVFRHNILEAALSMNVLPEDFLVERAAAHAHRLQRGADAGELEALAEIIREKAMTLQRVGLVVEEAKRLERATEPGLFEARDRWVEGTNPPPGTLRQFTYAVRRFCEVNGDLPLKSITKAHLRTFADRLRELPIVPNSQLDLNFDQAVAMGKRKGWKTIAHATLVKHVQGIKAIFAHVAKYTEWVDSNPFADFAIAEPRGKKSDRKDNGRKPFTSDQLEALITTLEAEKSLTDDDYWPPMLALYQGARLEEICQLDKADVVEIDCIPCLRITDALDEFDGDTDKKLKNKASVRTVPIHPALIAKGFMDFERHSKRASNGPKLFTSFEMDADKRWGGNYGKRFGRLLREKAKITDPKVVFHSFRHTWTDAARNAGLPFEIRAALAGRETEDDGVTAEALKSSEKGYGKGFSMPVLLEHLAKVDPLRAPRTRVTQNDAERSVGAMAN